MPLIASGVGAVGSYFGGRAANKAKSSTGPTYAPEFNPLKDRILQMTMQRLATDPDLTGYQSSGISNINRGYRNVGTAQSNNLTARGLSTSPIAGTVDTMRENSRAGDVAGFENQIPLLARQQKMQDLQLGGQVLGFGRGQQTQTEEGGGLGGGLTQLAKYMGYLSGAGMFGGQQNGGTMDGPGTGGFGGFGFPQSNRTPPFISPTPGQPLLPAGWSPYRPAGSTGIQYHPQGFTGWGG